MSTGPSAFPRTATWNSDLFGGPDQTVGSDILYPALRILRLVRAGQGPSPEVIAEALAALNAMIDSWNTENLMVRAILRTLFTLTAGDGEYTIGPGGQFVTADRPSSIERASLVNLSDPSSPLEQPMNVILTPAKWQEIALKSTQSSIPTDLYYDRGLSAGCGIVYLYPVPSTAHQLALYLESRLIQFQSEEDAFQMAPGYLRALQYNLAVELESRFDGAVLTQNAFNIATQSKASIKRKNYRPVMLKCDSALVPSRAGYDWRTGS